jgi:alpha-glucosidase (family GH31 glycosyl hydrolase)
VAPFAWMRWTAADGQPRRATTASLALESGERVFGLGQRSGPLNLIGTTQVVPPRAAAAPTAEDSPTGPPFLLSSRGYGLLVHTGAGLTAELGVRSATAYTVAVEEPALDLLIIPSNWPRTALAGYARLIGRSETPADAAFSVPTNAEITPPADVAAMRSRLREGLSFGLTAPGFWHADAAPDSDTPDRTASPALLARWAQLALLSPLVGAGAAPPHAPSRTDAPPRTDAPSMTDGPARDIVQAYARLRERLLPYLLHCARETAQTGLPMLRPMLLEFSWDIEAVEIDDQFLLGRDLLVAPVFSDSVEPVTRRVYLPAYANWYDWWTGTLHEGKRWVETTVPLDRVPIYVRAGTAIPLADPQPDSGEAQGDVTRLLLFAPRDGAIGASVELADDDMLGVEQERGERKARIFIEGISRTIRDLEIVGLPTSAYLVDASASSIALVPSDDLLPGLGGHWGSLTVRLDVGAFTAGLELGW